MFAATYEMTRTTDVFCVTIASNITCTIKQTGAPP